MLIGLHGKKQAGKDAAYGRIVARLPGATVERASFADLLYTSAAEALGVTVERLRELKSDPGATIELWSANVAAVARISVRQYLQNYGTEAHRNVFGTNFWVDAVDLSHDRKIVVVTDVRFTNEAQAIHDAGGTVVRVVGPPEVEEAGDGHASETPLPHALVDATIDNSIRDDGFRNLDGQVLALVLSLIKEERL